MNVQFTRDQTTADRITIGDKTFRIVAASCHCGCSWVWVQLHDYGVETTVGCVCHTLPSGQKVSAQSTTGASS